jgi:integrase
MHIMKNIETGVEAAKSKLKISYRAPSKTHLGYWNDAIFQQRPGGNWHMQVGHRGLQRKVSLGTPEKGAAAKRARDFYRRLMSDGWDAALAQFRPERVHRDLSTIGDFIGEVRMKADIDPGTLQGYVVALRKIISDAFGIDGGTQKFDYVRGGHADWIRRIHAVRLSDLTPAVVQRWKRDFVARAGNDPVKIRAAKISANSFLRRARTLFGQKATKHFARQLASPFKDVEFEKRQTTHYQSEIDLDELIRAACDELAPADPPAFLVVVLALCAGLRRMEIDRLEWSSILWNKNTIRIARTRYFEPKTESSVGDVPIDSEVIEILRGFHAKARSSFVIESPNLPRNNTEYRAQKVFKRVSKWLRSKGITSPKPLHTLRKESGSRINERFGLVAAQRFLRHSEIGVTARHYIDRPHHATTGLGSLLAAADSGKIVPLKDPTSHTLPGKTQKR